MRTAIIIFAILAAAAVNAFGVDRQLVQSVDSYSARVEPTAIAFFRGESVSYVVTPTYNGAAVSVSTNATARWYATLTTNVTLTVIDVAGTIATNGVATFALTTNQTAMAAGAYDSFVQISDTGRVLCASRSSLVVYKSTFAGEVAPATNAYYMTRTDPDGTTCVYSNGRLRVLSSGSGTTDHGALTNLNGDVDYQHISTARVAAIDAALPAAATNGAEWGSHASLLPAASTNGWEVGSHAGLATWAGATSAALAVVAPWTNQVTGAAIAAVGGLTNAAAFDAAGAAAAATSGVNAAFIAAAGGLTNRAFVTATALDCSPTTTITRAMIDAAPWGEMSLALTQATTLAFADDVTSGVDVATFRIWLKGTNALDWSMVTNKVTGSAWTNATATGSWRIFDKNPDGGMRIW